MKWQNINLVGGGKTIAIFGKSSWKRVSVLYICVYVCYLLRALGVT